MNILWRMLLLVGGASTWLAVAGNSAAGLAAPKRDPFQLPSMMAAIAAATRSAGGEEEQSLSSGEPTARVAPLRVRAIIYDSRHSLVNINGRILALGEALPEGHVLVRVSERHVVLAKDGKELRLQLQGEAF